MGTATATLGTSGFDRHPILAWEHGCVASASQDAARFLRELYRVAERLALRDVVVRSFTADWSGFGSWSIEASKGESEDRRGAAIEAGDYGAVGPDVVRVSWDGKDRILGAGLLHTTAISARRSTRPVDESSVRFKKRRAANRGESPNRSTNELTSRPTGIAT